VSVVVVGLNHRTVPLALLERVTIDDGRLPKALHDVLSHDHVSEAVVLSTCNRTEVYVVAEKFHPAYGDLRSFFSELALAAPEELADHLYVHDADAAARHLFRVASGLDSAVVGEAEILGQVRHSWDVAQAEGASGSQLNLLFRHALEIGKRARTETAIGRHVASVSTAAVAMAAERLGSLEGRSILVMGAGDMGEGMVRALASNGVSDIRIANRTWENAADLAQRLGGKAVRLADLDVALSEVDLLLTGTGANSMIIEHADIERVMKARGDREILVVDVAVPRDVDPAAADIPGVTILDMDDLRAFAEAGMPSVDAKSHRWKPCATRNSIDTWPSVPLVRSHPSCRNSTNRPRMCDWPNSIVSGPDWVILTNVRPRHSTPSPRGSWPSCCISPRCG